MTGLLFVPAKPLALRPEALAVTALNQYLAATNGKLQVYNAWKEKTENPSARLALSLIEDSAKLNQHDGRVLPILPAVSRSSIPAYIEDPIPDIMCIGEEEELPPELRPVLQDDGLPRGDAADAIQDDDGDYDALDVKNTPDYDPNQEGEAEFYDNDIVNAWLEADEEACAKGAKPRTYQRLDVPNETEAQIYSDHYDPSPPNSSSPFSPSLLVMQIPFPHHISGVEADEAFARMFRRYAYLTSHDDYVRVTAFSQNDPSLPRWLVIQEFTSLQSMDFPLKKKEVEYWWRKNGWEGLLVEAFQQTNPH